MQGVSQEEKNKLFDLFSCTFRPFCFSLSRMNNLINSLPGGRTLKKSEANLLDKLESFGVTLPNASDTLVRSNPFSGVSVKLDPVAVALFDFITKSYQNYTATRGTFSYRGITFPVSVWDRSRYLFLAYWPKAYYDLID